ncbi:down syndrome cell adhesion molecule [Caerostris extrusa]|uniref:Down syndrome cell adhesion molecule n=1 Tax=Caerostris extrusa TaxID=172846 RepID=A0AAV4VYA2_CAEEX|nr:down syndrome cell adhesion molecule [Caerostris extrusa]
MVKIACMVLKNYSLLASFIKLSVFKSETFILDSLLEDFKTIVSSSHVHILVNGSLNFRSVETTDEGSYLCEANNGVGPGLSTVVRLTVHSK